MMAMEKNMEPMPIDVLAKKQMKPEVQAEIRHPKRKRFSILATWNYFLPNFYKEHLCIRRMARWCKPCFRHVNNEVYTQCKDQVNLALVVLQIGMSKQTEISVPTLMVGAKYDTMDPKQMEEQSKLVQNGSYLYRPNGSHLAMWDDQKYL
jgi:proline iminopeptidase